MDVHASFQEHPNGLPCSSHAQQHHLQPASGPSPLQRLERCYQLFYVLIQSQCYRMPLACMYGVSSKRVSWKVYTVLTAEERLHNSLPHKISLVNSSTAIISLAGHTCSTWPLIQWLYSFSQSFDLSQSAPLRSCCRVRMQASSIRHSTANRKWGSSAFSRYSDGHKSSPNCSAHLPQARYLLQQPSSSLSAQQPLSKILANFHNVGLSTNPEPSGIVKHEAQVHNTT